MSNSVMTYEEVEQQLRDRGETLGEDTIMIMRIRLKGYKETLQKLQKKEKKP